MRSFTVVTVTTMKESIPCPLRVVFFHQHCLSHTLISIQNLTNILKINENLAKPLNFSSLLPQR